MPTRLLALCVALLIALGLAPPTRADTKITQYGITWTFDKDYPAGRFVNGDWWVVGPVKVVSITTDLHAPGFTPKPGEDGSMVNPGTDDKQGYDSRLKSYRAELNAALPNGKPISADNPLELKPNSSLVSMVSWLFETPEKTEPGAPRFDAGVGATRSATRSGAVLTVLAAPAPANAFRPPYCGSDKTPKFTTDQLDRTKLLNLAPVAKTPDAAGLAKQIERPWIDHVNQWMGAFVHPTDNMPNYGRDMAYLVAQASLLVHIDPARVPGGKEGHERLLVSLVQMGIDFAGIADNGGGWPANGGHHLGRKWPILFAGLMLNDEHMKSVGTWKTRFHEDEQTFVVSQAEVDLTNSPNWKPDKRGGNPTPYTKDDIGTPEWGIGHKENPAADNKEWATPYRSINGTAMPGMVLAARLMKAEQAWNHPPLFAYIDRYMEKTKGATDNHARVPEFVLSMWNEHNPKPAK
jgi:hypothetical protein